MLKRDARLGQYKIVRFLGEGGMGAVYEAVHVELDRRVALKTLRSDVESLPTLKERFLREGQAAARIKHPHIVDVYDAGQADGTAFLVMEFLDGEDLEALLRRETRLGADRALDLMVPVMAAVAALHQQGVIHRDLKPQNVFLTRGPYGEPVPKVLDFGISKISTADGALTGAGEALGSPYYMSPEQARGITDLSTRTDQFSLGVILYEMLAGVRPFDAPNVIAVLFAIQQGEFVPLHERVAAPRALSEAVSKALSKDPARRFPSVLDLALALLPFAGERTRVLWTPLLGAGSQAAPAAGDRTAAGRRSSVTEMPQAAPESPARPREVTRPPDLSAVRTGSTPATGARKATGTARAVGSERPATPPPKAVVGPARTGPIKATAAAVAAQRRRRTSEQAAVERAPLSAPGTGWEETTAPRRAWPRAEPEVPAGFGDGLDEPAIPAGFGEDLDEPAGLAQGVETGETAAGEADPAPTPMLADGSGDDTGEVKVWRNELLCISRGDPGATLRARQLIRSSRRLVMLYEAKVPSPETKAPLVHVLGAARGALDVVAIIDDGKGRRDPYGDLCKELVPLRYDANNAYIFLQGGRFQDLVRMDLFDPLADAERISDWVAQRTPAARKWRRPKE